ncbi:MAG: hypothetical protein ACYC9O_03085 [Candidatus Latescibacterota bacterium]
MYTELVNNIEQLTREIRELTRRTENRLQKEEADDVVRASLRRSVKEPLPRRSAA